MWLLLLQRAAGLIGCFGSRQGVVNINGQIIPKRGLFLRTHATGIPVIILSERLNKTDELVTENRE